MIALALLLVFLSSFLLFQVQPMMARALLPPFGGSASVWTVALFFFQSLLLGAYLVSHWLSRLSARQRYVPYVLILLAAVATLPLSLVHSGQPEGRPTMQLLLSLLVSCGIPLLALGISAPLFQRWASERRDGNNYYFYAVSNLGSLAGLLVPPFLLDPVASLDLQFTCWSLLFCGFALLAAFLTRSAHGTPSHHIASGPIQTCANRWLWFSLSFISNLILIGITNRICRDIAPVPLLWVVPLALFLVAYIVAFGFERLYQRRLVLCVMLLLALCSLSPWPPKGEITLTLSVSFLALFFACYLCNAEIVRLKPSAENSSTFYLYLAFGGAAAAFFACLVAPAIFTDYTEYPLALLGLGLTMMVILLREDRMFTRSSLAKATSILSLTALLCGASYTLLRQERPNGEVLRQRSFFGVLRLVETAHPTTRENVLTLSHDTIIHGSQFLEGPFRGEPTGYYGRATGVGRLIETLQSRGPLRIGVIGLGAGTLAAYGRSGDTLEFFEINPAIIDIALSKFSYITNSAASTKVHLGDGRVRLQAYDCQPFDILVIDAFSGDSIPTHLLSTEALTLYLRHLTPHGVVIFHISNLYLDLGPVVSSIARATDTYAARLLPTRDAQGVSGPSEYALVTADAPTLHTLEKAGIVGPLSYCASLPAWTDNYADVWSVRKDAVRRCTQPKPLSHGTFE